MDPRNAILKAARQGDAEDFERQASLLPVQDSTTKGAIMAKIMNNSGCTVLHLAAAGGNTFVLDYMLREDVFPNTDEGRARRLAFLNKKSVLGDESAVLTAIRYHQRNFVVRLLQAGAEINTVRSNGFGPLHCAMERGGDNMKMLCWLIEEYHCPADQKEAPSLMSPLHFAAFNDRWRCFSLLVEMRPQDLYDEYHGLNSIEIAVKYGAERVQAIMVQEGLVSDVILQAMALALERRRAV
ncbi:ankyrin repeat-containing domain protein [Bombardia bombarda]|uniref:Ankyrin repeat-containing domain protein n=1 Tax=Bombardia bombarda TaxID=252184 RepID=A0AA39X0B7_9PEZI|nr:ankyrin repeat-containing domain protein [Bombardia bombarda]